MHELSLAEEVITSVTETARTYGVDRVAGLTLRVGKYSCVDKSSLSFALEAMAPDTVLDGAAVAILDVEPAVVCPACGRTAVADDAPAICPVCGQPAKLMSENDLYIEAMELDVEEDTA